MATDVCSLSENGARKSEMMKLDFLRSGISFTVCRSSARR
jgi:hypothetical protein